jgi:hypothetical protein
MSSNIKGGGKKGSKKDGVGGGLVCAHCKKVGALDTMKRCSRCRRVCYCSVECQKLHWKKGGHKKVCVVKGSSGDLSDGVFGASGGGGASLKNPCPICLDNEDDAGEEGVCTSCGQMFCGSCKKSLEQRGIANCPTCRAVLGVPAKEDVRRLRQLLARPTGSHTAVAQYTLAYFIKNGTGVAQDIVEAARLYRLAAEGGHMLSQYNIGSCYDNGFGVAQDAAEAVRWYRLAADRGYMHAQNNIGYCYANGTGVAEDALEAVRWYRLAAAQGHAHAQFGLGCMCREGTGVAQDAAEAARWDRLAADQGLSSAQFHVGIRYENGDGVAQDNAEAMRWYRLAAVQGHADAQSAVARLGM